MSSNSFFCVSDLFAGASSSGSPCGQALVPLKQGVAIGYEGL